MLIRYAEATRWQLAKEMVGEINSPFTLLLAYRYWLKLGQRHQENRADEELSVQLNHELEKVLAPNACQSPAGLRALEKANQVVAQLELQNVPLSESMQNTLSGVEIAVLSVLNPDQPLEPRVLNFLVLMLQTGDGLFVKQTIDKLRLAPVKVVNEVLLAFVGSAAPFRGLEEEETIPFAQIQQRYTWANMHFLKSLTQSVGEDTVGMSSLLEMWLLFADIYALAPLPAQVVFVSELKRVTHPVIKHDLMQQQRSVLLRVVREKFKPEAVKMVS